ncbi:hypothetical protein RJ639_036958, partial [Escallonia herrerae]
MDMAGQDKFEPEKRNEDHVDYNSPSISSDWRLNGANFTNTTMGMISAGNPMAACKGDVMGQSSRSSASVMDSFCPTIWDQPTNSQNLGFCDINSSTSNALGTINGGPGFPTAGSETTLNMGWSPPNSMLKGGMFLPATSQMLPQSLSQFPADSGFIERAARFSCFSGGNFSNMMNPFIIPECTSPYSRGVAPMQGPQEVFVGSGLNSVSGGHTQKNEMSMGCMAEGSKDVSLSVEHGASEGSLLNNEKKNASSVRSRDEAKQGVDVSGNESEEAEFSGGGQGDPSVGETSVKGLGSKKRKRYSQDTGLDQAKGVPQTHSEATKDNTENQDIRDRDPTSTTNKPSGKNGKQGTQAFDSCKEEYIHIRARRGQATNSHSLAERVRREKISERMKFLQDLVPGCSKVTGKAVMLDEIINYVQSLQRQVEFLSMKLSTVNPRLDFNIEGLLAKDILQSRAGPSSTHGFPPDMTMPYPPMHPSQSGVIQTGLPGMGNSSDALRRTINSHLAALSGGYKESPTSQVPNTWEDELHNVVQMMGFDSGAPPNSQDIT